MEVGSHVTVHAFRQYTVCVAPANEPMQRADYITQQRVCVWLVLRVKRPEIMRAGGHFHSCKSMLNTPLPLEQLPYPKQLYGRAGSGQVNSDIGQLPRTGVSAEL